MCEPTTSYPCSCRGTRRPRIDAAGHRDEHGRHGVQATVPLPCATRHVSWPVIEARFDDLTGAEPSFRLVGPAGVLEARRPDEVTGVLAAAEQAAASRPVGRGVRRLRGRTRASTASLEVRAPTLVRSVRRPAARVVRAVRGTRGDEPARTTGVGGRGRRRPGHGWTAGDDPPRYDAAVDRDPSSDRRGRHVPGESARCRSRPRFEGDARGCIGIFPSRSAAPTAPTSTRGRHPHPVGLTRALLPDRRGPHRSRSR